MSYTVDDVVAKYLMLRDLKATMENKHKLELMPINDNLKTLENVLSTLVASNGGLKIQAEAGTAYTRSKLIVTATDLPKFVDFAVVNEPRMLNIQPSTNGVNDYIKLKEKENSKLADKDKVPIFIPGLKIEFINIMNVRAKGTKE